MTNYKKYMLIALVILSPFIIYAIIGFIFTSRTERDILNQQFINGTIPNPLPNGDLKGSADYQDSWLGKSFNPENQSGINNFADGDKITHAYTFKTYQGKGLRDPNTNVLKIDYNLPENPIYLRFILDEIVEIEPGKYLGKLHIRLIPFIPFTVTFFRLEK